MPRASPPTTWRHLRAGVYAGEPLLLLVSPEEMARSLRTLGEPPVTNGRAIATLVEWLRQVAAAAAVSQQGGEGGEGGEGGDNHASRDGRAAPPAPVAPPVSPGARRTAALSRRLRAAAGPRASRHLHARPGPLPMKRGG